MIRKLAPYAVEEGMAVFQGSHQRLEAVDFDVGYFLQLCDIVEQHFIVVGFQYFIGAPGWQYFYFEGSFQRNVVLQCVDWVIGGANHLHLHLTHQVTHTVLRGLQQGGGLVEYFLGCIGAQQGIDAEVAAQLQVGPVVQWIADGGWHGGGPSLKFLIERHITGAILFVDAIGAHGPPFVMVAFEPNLAKALKVAILCNHLGREVAVEINDGQLAGVLMVETLGCLAF